MKKLLNIFHYFTMSVVVIIICLISFTDITIYKGLSLIFFLIILSQTSILIYLTLFNKKEFIEIFYEKENSSVFDFIMGKIVIVLIIIMTIVLILEFDYQGLQIILLLLNMIIYFNYPILKWEVIIENNTIYFLKEENIEISEIISFEKQTNGSIYFEIANRKRVIELNFEVADDLSAFLNKRLKKG